MNNKKRSNFNIMWNLLGMVKPLSGWMFIAVVTGVLGFLCASFITIFGGIVLMEFSGLQTAWNSGVNGALLCMALFAVLRGGLHYIEHACNHYIAFKLLALIRDKVFAQLRKLAPAKLDGVDKGNLIALVTSDIELLEIFFAHTISPICIAVVMAGFMVNYIGGYHTTLGMIALVAYVFVGIVIPVIMSKFSRSVGELQREENAEMNTYVLDSLRGIKEIKQYNFAKIRLDKMSEMTEEMSDTGEALKGRIGFTNGITNIGVLGFSILMFYTSIQLCLAGEVTFDVVVISTLAIFSSFGAFIALANLGVGLSQTMASGSRLLALLEESPVVEDVLDGSTPEMNTWKLENVDFAYEDEEILKDMNLEVKPGEITGIIGKSGSGKSTMLKLLMRFWDVNNGAATVDGTDIKEINTAHLRQNQSLVTQETHLFHDSVLNNIKLAKLDATQEEIVEACKKASVHEFIMTLPEGYDTQVGELGDTLSGGERQRIGLARAFLHDAKCLFLDEPTSNLDSLNEAVILKALKEDTDRTVLLVSHRASTMKVADTVINVEGNRVS